MSHALTEWILRHGEDALWADFDTRTLNRGLRYADEGRVADINWSANGFVARVMGTTRSGYHTSVQIVRARGGVWPMNWCTCPVGEDCKHAVAALAVYLQQEQPLQAGGADDPRTRLWLQDLESAAHAGDGAPEPGRELLVYVVSAQDGAPPAVGVWKTRVLKDGSYGKAYRFNGDGRSRARFVTAADTRIQRMLPRMGTERMADADIPLLLTWLAGTGRAYLGSLDGPPLRPGGEREGAFEWTAGEADTQSLHCRVGAGDRPVVVVAGAPPWYIDTETGEAGPIASGLPEALAARLVQAPGIPDEACESVAATFRNLGLSVPEPQPAEEHELADTRPVPCLALDYADGFGGGPGSGDGAVATLSFDYHGFELPPERAPATTRCREGGKVWRIQRDVEAERAALEMLAELELEPEEHFGDFLFLPEQPGDWARVLASGVPWLRANGWRVTVVDDFPFRMVEADDWYADLGAGTGEAWFDLELGIDVEGERHSLVPILVQTIRQQPQMLAQAQVDHGEGDEDGPLMIHLGDGRLVPLPMARIAPMLRTLSELYDPKQPPDQTALRLPTARAAVLDELESTAALRWEGDAGLRELAARLAALERVEPAAAPPGLQGTLRGYQREGVGWLQALGSQGLGGVLADDMGLGKTIQILAHLLHERASGRADRPSLVVAPRSLLFNWAAEAEKFAPELRVLRLHGPQRHGYFAELERYDLVLTTYALAARDRDRLAEQAFHLCVLDEAQAVKNPQAKAAKAVRQLDARQRICLTGTPLENHLGELWTQFDFLLPGLLGDRTTFNRLFRRPIEREGDAARQRSLQQRIRPFLLRRTKEAIADELPPITTIERHAELSGAQRDLYETVRTAMERRVRDAVDRQGLARSHVVVLEALLKLRQACCDPRLLEGGREIRTSAKLDLLLELLHELHAEGRRILLFSQFTSMLTLIEQALADSGIEWLKLTGRTKKRQQRVERFQTGEVPLFLISLKAGGTGLNLTAADTVIHYDPWWNPAVMRQATDRAHRIGQNRPVFVYHLLTHDTVEERITGLQRRKAELGEWLLGGEGGSASTLAMDDVERLLEPID